MASRAARGLTDVNGVRAPTTRPLDPADLLDGRVLATR